MFIVDLICDDGGHRFEGWYESSAEYEGIRDSGELSCPLCESTRVRSSLATGSIRTGKTIARHARTQDSLVASEATEPPQKLPLEVQQALAKVLRHVQRTHEDVGGGFSDTARAIHRGEQPSRPIHGTATEEQEQQMQDEGVPFAKVPIPDIESN